MKNTIAFPKLGLEFHIDRVAIPLGNLNIYWYALIIVSGIVLGFSYALYFTKKEKLHPDTLYDVLLWGLPSAIVMARIYYVIFNFSDYQNRLLDVFKIWEGGIAIYGGVIGALVSTYIYAKKKKLPVLQLYDLGAFGLIVGQAVGRWGNFVNQEAFGRNTDSVLAMTGNLIREQLISLQKAGVAVDPAAGVHPTFLYESLWNAVGAVVLGVLHRKKKQHGQIFFSYLLWYGVGRFFIEGLRTDSLYFFGIRISQGLALVSAIGSAIVLRYLYRKAPATEAENELPVEETTKEENASEEISEQKEKFPRDKEIRHDEQK